MSRPDFGHALTTGGLHLYDSVALAELALHLQDWRKVRATAGAENLLQARTATAGDRLCRELIYRLRELEQQELEAFWSASFPEQKLLLWIAICRRYRMIGALATGALRERYATGQVSFTPLHYDTFMRSLLDQRPAAARHSEQTLKKQRRLVLLILREADLVSPTDEILGVIPSPALLQSLAPHRRTDLEYLPIADNDLRRLLP
jgi:hypothetical protein